MIYLHNYPFMTMFNLQEKLTELKLLGQNVNIFNTDQKCFMKINIESSPPEIWIGIHFHNGSGSPSLNETRT